MMLIESQIEAHHDELQKYAVQAMMIRKAYHSKKLKMDDLYKRPSDVVKAEKEYDNAKEMMNHTKEWLAQFTFKEKEVKNNAKSSR